MVEADFDGDGGGDGGGDDDDDDDDVSWRKVLWSQICSIGERGVWFLRARGSFCSQCINLYSNHI